jgi:chromosome segregation ATPase
MSSFPSIGPHSLDSENEGSFWPSFTDIMMVVVMIFLMATSLLIVRNWQLVNELQQSIEAEKLASEMIESTSQENATLEERLINAEQLNSILRLRIMEKDELLAKAKQRDEQRLLAINKLENDKARLNQTIETSRYELTDARQKIIEVSAESEEFAQQLAELKLQLERQKQLNDATQQELEFANAEIAALNATADRQQINIELLESEKINYNRQLLTLKGEYDVVKSKYDQLIKPARSARGKYVAEVYYVKEKGGEVYRFKEPTNKNYQDLSLAEVEKRLDKLKQEKGADLYVKIIIPKDSGLTYNEAWNFMRSLLQKYDYYYQSENTGE